MQKLEEILHAEDSAHTRLIEAREQAAKIASEAVAEAQLVRVSAKREAAEAAAMQREAVLAQAHKQSAQISADAEDRLRTLMESAESRVSHAAQVVARELAR